MPDIWDPMAPFRTYIGPIKSFHFWIQKYDEYGYDDPNYWSAETLKDEYSKFENLATAFGKTHVKDPEGKDLYLDGLDGDSKPVSEKQTTPLEGISDAQLRARLSNLYSKFGEPVTTTILDFLQKYCFFVKTKKPYGFHAYWLSHTQRNPIGTGDCKLGMNSSSRLINRLDSLRYLHQHTEMIKLSTINA